MPWYKVEARTGPGHQSHYLNYLWQDKRLTRQEALSLFEDELRHRANPVGSVVAVRRLPAKVRDQKIAMYRGRIENASRMLAMLIPKPSRAGG